MNSNKHFEKYYSKLRLEAILKSAICGVSVGFGANLLAALITYFMPFNGLWLCIGIFAGVSVAASLLFYFKKYRPNDYQNASRIDRLGLEERLITMVEFEGDDSYIAKAQREDAKAVLSTVTKSSIRFLIPKAVIVPAICLSVCASGMMTLNALADSGVIKGGDEILEEFQEEKRAEYVTVTYIVEEGGVIEGDEAQVIIKGTDASRVTAVADEGYMFQGWSDESENPTRIDKGVNESVVYVAVFVEVEDGEPGDDGEGDEPTDEPGERSQNQSNGNSNDSSNSTSGGGIPTPDGSDNIVDGNTDYHGELGNAQDNAESRGEEGGYSGNQGSIVGGYLGTL